VVKQAGALDLVSARVRRLPTLAIVSVGGAAGSLLAPWSISILPAHLVGAFGFQTPACWLLVVALVAAAFLDLRRAALALTVAAAAVAGWFAWAMWVVTTPSFTRLPFDWVGTDVIGAGWYVAAVALLGGAIALVKRFADAEAPVGPEQWLFTALPGLGLMRLGAWGVGLIYTGLFAAAFYLGSTDSPDPTQFQEYARTYNVPPPIPRAPEWILFGVAGAIWVVSVAATVRLQRREVASWRP
jgi:hypothetical protein